MKEDPLLEHAPIAPGDWKSTLSYGYAIMVFAVVVTFTWSAIARIDGAVTASSIVAVSSNRKEIQHLEGGIVREILVRDGSIVNKGDVLLRLDPTRSMAAAETYEKQLAQAQAQEARLEAQRSLAKQVTFPESVMKLASDPQVASAISDNRRQFDSRLATLQSSLDVIDAQLAQAQKQIEQAAITKKTSEDQILTVKSELEGVMTLYKKGFVALPRVTALQRQESGLQGAIDGAIVSIAQAQDKVNELTASADQLRKTYVQEAAAALPDVRKTIGDLTQQIIVAKDSLRRVDITAPVSGSVQSMKVFTIGGVVRPGDVIMEIVPSSDVLVLRAKILPDDIDRVRVGQEVDIQLTQFREFRSEIIKGTLETLSHDVIEDVKTGGTYYAAEVSVDRSSIPPEIRDRIIPGMQAVVFMPTGERTVLQFLVAPIFDRFYSSMTER
ncbi:HlyD family type I secretion periplasmic adaptor subunit [Aquabacter sp. P-9]|uniref:HlyD family type I secretion periplasmic adaptor subunit n=1 Tax=Aquabacter sediminis TaxID=3029197 RepID=UPI00237D68DE|nr:HlyD family type I secretion periplasmic adaptor subunit [Aquabacter sp. P-9]MDE1567640.1 HlyD family type I secretion periplasmic adaptor subunit [Aquabacter sp. P-9]